MSKLTKADVAPTLKRMRDLAAEMQDLQDRLHNASPKTMTTASMSGYGLVDAVGNIRSAITTIENLHWLQ